MKHPCASPVHDLKSRQRPWRILSLARGIALAALCAMVPLSSGAHAQSTLFYDRWVEPSGISVVPAGGAGLFTVKFETKVFNDSGTPLDMDVDASVFVNDVLVDLVHVSFGGGGGGGGGPVGSGPVGNGPNGSFPAGCGDTAQPNCWDCLLTGECFQLIIPNNTGLSCICVLTARSESWGSLGTGHTLQLGDRIRIQLDPAAGAVTEIELSNDSAEIDFLGMFSYCTAGTSSNGCVPAISSSGLPSLSASTFVISVANLEGAKQGLLFYGISGRAAAVWGPGSTSLLCVKSPTQRMGVQSTGGNVGACNGTLVADFIGFSSTHPSALGNPFVPGTVVDVQAWYRDPAAVKTTNLSDALEFTLLP